MATLLAVGRMLLFALLGTTQLTTEKGFATSFGGEGDALVGGHMACTHRNMGPGDRICAHRTLPCGTVVMVQNLRTKQMASCVVQDRGPYGATLPNGEIILKVRASEEGTWRGLIDLSPAVAQDIGLRGREMVALIYERPGRKGKPPRWAAAQPDRAQQQSAVREHLPPWAQQCRAPRLSGPIYREAPLRGSPAVIDRCEDPLTVSWMAGYHASHL